MEGSLLSDRTEFSSSVVEELFSSPEKFSSADKYAANPGFLKLQDELRFALFHAVTTLESTDYKSPLLEPEGPQPRASRSTLHFSRVISIPKTKIIFYLKNWITECAPHLDTVDGIGYFSVCVPILAQAFPALFYAILAFSARQTERKACHDKACDSLELYQESICLLAQNFQAKDPNVLVTVCILAVMELMSGSPREWRRHIEGCAALFDSFHLNGFSDGHLQAIFWCYARMELCGAIISNSEKSIILLLKQLVPPLPEVKSKDAEEAMIRDLFYKHSHTSADMYANWAVYLCAKVCDLSYRQTRYLELGETAGDLRPFSEQWNRLWNELQYWTRMRPRVMMPIKNTGMSSGHLFPEILFAHCAAISGNQLYHAASIMMLDIRPIKQGMQVSKRQFSAIWHARRVCGISLANPYCGDLMIAIQLLYIAGKLLSHRSEHVAIAKVFSGIERTTGWCASWRLKDLERAWGYEVGEIIGLV